MANRIVPFYTIATDYDQAGEDALSSTLTGQSIGALVIFNTTVGKTRIWNGSAFISAPMLNPDGGNWSGGGGAAFVPSQYTFISQQAWTNKALALQEFLNTNQRRLTIDMTNATQFRIISDVTVQGVAASVTGIQYSTDGGTTWRGLDNGNSGSNSTVTVSDLGTGSKVSAWTNLAIGVSADVLVRIAGSGGDGVADPAFSNISIQLK